VTIPVGLAHEAEFRPERWHVAAAIGNDGVMAVSTPAILGFLEQASLEAIAPYQGQHEVSVGAHVTLDHVAPAFPGLAIRGCVRVESVSGRRISFAVIAEQAGRTIAKGSYVRVIVPSERFHAPPSDLSGQALAPVEFWFDFHSPWSYLASLRLPPIAARHARPVRWIPIHVARLIETIGGRRPLDENPAFVRWYREDLMRWARRTGVSIRYHPDFPLRPARACSSHSTPITARDLAYALRRSRSRALFMSPRFRSTIIAHGGVAAGRIYPTSRLVVSLTTRYRRGGWTPARRPPARHAIA
jgi:predicted thioesterase